MMRVLSLWSAQAHRELVQALLKLWTHRFRALVRGAAEAHGDGGADLAAALGRLDEQIDLVVQMVGAVGDRLAVVPVPCTPLLLRPSMGGCRGGAYLGVGHTTSACGAPPLAPLHSDASGACRVATAGRGFRC